MICEQSGHFTHSPSGTRLGFSLAGVTIGLRSFLNHAISTLNCQVSTLKAYRNSQLSSLNSQGLSQLSTVKSQLSRPISTLNSQVSTLKASSVESSALRLEPSVQLSSVSCSVVQF